MTGIKTVLFDLDGTLIDSRADLANAVNHALKTTGLPEQSQEEIIPYVGNGLRNLLSDVMGPVSDELLDQGVSAFTSFYNHHCVDHTVLYKGVYEVLVDLNKSHRLGIVTNKPESFSHKILKKLGVANFMGVIIGGDSLPERKPHPAPVIKAMRDLGEKIESTLIVGDGTQDVQAGQTAGVQTCIARYGYGFREETLDLKPNFQINNFNELKEIVS